MEKSDDGGDGEESAVLKLISNPLPAVIPLGMKHVVVGRSPTCDIVLNLPEISAQHCYLEIGDNRWFIKDISLNGIWVGNEKLEKNIPRILNHQDLIKFGPKLVYRFNNTQTTENSSEGTVFLEGRWWNENDLGGRCFIMGRWWENLQEWLDETSQKLEYNGPPSPQLVEDQGVDERMEVEGEISLEIEQPVAKIARMDDGIDVGGAGDNTTEDIFIKRRLFYWLARPHPPSPSIWKPPTQGLGKLFFYIRDELRSKGWRGKDEDMKLSAEYKQWLRTLTGIEAYQKNLNEVDLNFNGMPIFVCRNEDKLFYSIGKLKKEFDPNVGSSKPNSRNNYEVKRCNWESVCVECSCWKQSMTKGKCEEHGERNRELFLVIDRHNKGRVVLMLFNANHRSSDYDRKSLNESIHSAEARLNRSLQDYMTERGVPESISRIKRYQEYKAKKYTDKKIQQLEKEYWKARFSKVEFEVLQKWKLSNSKKDMYNKIYDTVQVGLSILVSTHNTKYPDEKKFQLLQKDIEFKHMSFQLLEKILCSNNFSIAVTNETIYAQLDRQNSPFLSPSGVNKFMPSTYFILEYDAVYDGLRTSRTAKSNAGKTSANKNSSISTRGLLVTEKDPSKSLHTIALYQTKFDEESNDWKVVKSISYSNSKLNNEQSRIIDFAKLDCAKAETMGHLSNIFGMIQKCTVDGMPLKLANKKFSHFDEYENHLFQYLEDLFDFKFEKRITLSSSPIKLDTRGQPVFDLHAVGQFLE